MAKRQTRRSISLTAEAYVRAQRLAARLNLSVSGMFEKLLAEACDKHEVPLVERGEALDVIKSKRRPPPLQPWPVLHVLRRSV